MSSTLADHRSNPNPYPSGGGDDCDNSANDHSDGDQSISTQMTFRDLRNQWEEASGSARRRRRRKKRGGGESSSSPKGAGGRRSGRGAHSFGTDEMAARAVTPVDGLKLTRGYDIGLAGCGLDGTPPQQRMRCYPNRNLYGGKKSTDSTASETNSDLLVGDKGAMRRKSSNGSGKGKGRVQRGDLARGFDMAVDRDKITKLHMKTAAQINKTHGRKTSASPKRNGGRRPEERRRSGSRKRIDKNRSSRPGSRKSGGSGENGESSERAQVRRLQKDIRGLLSSSPLLHFTSGEDGSCEICLGLNEDDYIDATNRHPTIQCKILSEKDIGVEGKNRLEDVLRGLQTKVQLLSDAGRADQPPELTKEQRQDIFVSPHIISKGLSKNKIPPKELESFLNCPTGLNWEDLVRSLKQKREGKLINATIELDTGDCDVSELGSREGNYYSGDYDVDWNDDDANGERRRSGGGGSDEEEDDDEHSFASDISSISDESLCFGRRRETERGVMEQMLKRAIIKKKSSEKHAIPPRQITADKAAVEEEGNVNRSDTDREQVASAKSSPKRSPPQTKSLPRDSLRRKIEKVIRGQQAETQKEDHHEPASPKQKQSSPGRMPKISPPPATARGRLKSRTRQPSRAEIASNNPSPKLTIKLGGNIGSAFTPVKSPGTPATDETMMTCDSEALLATPKSSYSHATSPKSMASPGSRSGISETNFTPIAHKRNLSSSQLNLLQQPEIVAPQPVTPKPITPPRPSSAKRCSPRDVDVAPRVMKHRRDESPSDPPLLYMSPSGEEEESNNNNNNGEGDDDGNGTEDDSFFYKIRGGVDPSNDEGGATNLSEIFRTNDGNEGGNGVDYTPFATGQWENDHGDVDEQQLTEAQEGEVEVASSSEGTVRISILPESLSINRRNPTCWQVTRHRVRRTKGEF